MARSEFEDQSDYRKTRKIDRRLGKRINEFDDDDTSYKQKRSSKRFHRKKTLKDEFWNKYIQQNSIQKGKNTGPKK